MKFVSLVCFFGLLALTSADSDFIWGDFNPKLQAKVQSNSLYEEEWDEFMIEKEMADNRHELVQLLQSFEEHYNQAIQSLMEKITTFTDLADNGKDDEAIDYVFDVLLQLTQEFHNVNLEFPFDYIETVLM
ncbi:hypothetical protein Ciccas_007053 [Cichlidogyrus casuarinus]|uniref:Uncharacterized protein n=1 Tax=Cichlidogyrus casuarinus TaxID=1844966 RepID=A0ABD2Q533_9PLAT